MGVIELAAASEAGGCGTVRHGGISTTTTAAATVAIGAPAIADHFIASGTAASVSRRPSTPGASGIARWTGATTAATTSATRGTTTVCWTVGLIICAITHSVATARRRLGRDIGTCAGDPPVRAGSWNVDAAILVRQGVTGMRLGGGGLTADGAQVIRIINTATWRAITDGGGTATGEIATTHGEGGAKSL